MTTGATPRLWLDVEDMFAYARGNPRPSGIQRVAFELCRALQDRYGESGLIHFVRHDPSGSGFRSASWSEIAVVFGRLSEGKRASSVNPGPVRRPPFARSLKEGFAARLPLSLQMSAQTALQAQSAALRAWGSLGSVALRGTLRRLGPLQERLRSARADNVFACESGPGDVVMVVGSPWSQSNYPALISAQRMRGLRFAALFYDLIPLRHPEWCDPGIVRSFRAWVDSMLPLCDHPFAISRATADDVAAYAQEQGLGGLCVVPLPMGSGFGMEQLAPEHTSRLPAPGTYALFVSTIEARKNHQLLFRLWQKLLREMPNNQVPSLVFAGRVGWFVDDLMRQIAATESLRGRLLIIEDPTDGELAALYQGCLFTLFPSFAEGWGLPVSESLSFGKPCLIADQPALREAGGASARIFDPDNLHSAYTAVRAVIEDREGLTRWTAQVREAFRPVPWSVAADALMQELGYQRSLGQRASVLDKMDAS